MKCVEVKLGSGVKKTLLRIWLD